MESLRSIDVQSFINSHKLSGYQILIVVLCFFIIAVDGFDTAAIGYIAPAIKEEWGLTPAHLAPLFGAGLLGLMVGAFVIGPFADKFGRKPVLLFAVGFFGLASLISGYATSEEQLLVLRFITGLGLGGAMPNAITVTSEYCPERHRSVLVTSMFCGFTVGSALGGVAAAHIVADFGWRAVLILGGVLPLVFVPILWWKLPESVRYLVLAGKDSAQVTRVLHNIAPKEALDGAKFMVPEKRLGGFPVKHLFDQGLLRGTLLLWIVFFMSLLVFYLLTNWLPTVIKSTGVSMKEASVFQVAAIPAVLAAVSIFALGRQQAMRPTSVHATGARSLG